MWFSKIFKKSFIVLILPMRNGNTVYLNHIEYIQIVLILPMRNGNGGFDMGLNIDFEFLSYLWGMETFFINSSSFAGMTFLSYLWGMETTQEELEKELFNLFLSYLWGMETTKNSVLLWFVFFCSYPTYEEWKLTWFRMGIPTEKEVLILPMRNGNMFRKTF